MTFGLVAAIVILLEKINLEAAKTAPHFFVKIMQVLNVKDKISSLADMRRKRNPRTDLAALDLGCGQGAAAILLSQKGFFVDAVDKSRERLESLRNYIESNREARIWVFEGDIREFRFYKNRYDIVVSFNLAHLLSEEDKRWLFKKIFYSMRPGSFAAILWKGERENLFKYFSKFDVPYINSFEADGDIYTYVELGKAPLFLRIKRFLASAGDKNKIYKN